jgi:hypothetical protein
MLLEIRGFPENSVRKEAYKCTCNVQILHAHALCHHVIFLVQIHAWCTAERALFVTFVESGKEEGIASRVCVPCP